MIKDYTPEARGFSRDKIARPGVFYPTVPDQRLFVPENNPVMNGFPERRNGKINILPAFGILFLPVFGVRQY